MTVRNCLLFLVIMGFLLASCGRKKDLPGPDEPEMERPEAPLEPGEVPVVPSPAPDAELPPEARPIMENLERFNRCVLELAKWLHEEEKAVQPKEAAGRFEPCEKNFLEVLENDEVQVTEPYREYFLLAARLLDRLSGLTVDSGRPFDRDGFVADYNAFAMKNNELLGIPLVEGIRPQTARKLPRRTYMDELVRAKEHIGNFVVEWQFGHRFEILGSGGPAAWFPFGRHAHTRFWLDLQPVLVQVGAFRQLECSAEGTDKEDRHTCETLKGSGQELLRRFDEWTTAWRDLLRTARDPAWSPKPDQRQRSEKATASLNGFMQLLPGREGPGSKD